MTQTEAQGLQDLHLHLADLELYVTVISYTGKVFNSWAQYLFIFAGNKHSCHTNQL